MSGLIGLFKCKGIIDGSATGRVAVQRLLKRDNMTIKVNLHLALQKYAEGKKAVEVGGRTVGECIGILVETYPELKSFLFDPGGKLKSYIGVYVNRQSAYPRELDTFVRDGDEIHLVTIFAGG